MSTRDDGGSAFPYEPERRTPAGKDMELVTPGQERGMSLRDYFAGKALHMAWDYARRINADGEQGKEDKHECRYDLYVDPDGGSDDSSFVAAIAYRMADAMLKERAQ